MSGLRHEALLYGGEDEFASGVARFVGDGLAAGEPVLVAVPAERHALARRALGAAGHEVRLMDMREVGRNPGRILSAISDWVDAAGARRRRFVGEPIWRGRSADEIAEATTHEALINLALADAPITVLCPYDVRGLAPGVLCDAERTHPHLVCEERRSPSGAYDVAGALASAGAPLPPPPGAADTFGYGFDGVRAVRRVVRGRAEREGLAADRVADLVLAAGEAATNTVRHAGGRGTLAVWRHDGRLVCEFSDDGRIADPLAGRRRPPRDEDHGRGLWLMHQLCDLVQVRSGSDGTTVRMQMRLA